MTDVLQVITQYCDIYVDDIRLQSEKTTDFPLYAHKMWGYLRAAIPFFNKPEEIQNFLCGENGENLNEPSFASYQTALQSEQSGEFTLSSADYIGYDYCSTRIVTVDQFGDVKYQPIASAYEQESGTITITPSETLAEETIIETDFYKDGYFVNTLTPEMMKILGLCFAYVWKLRFNNDWLSDVSKIEDNSFSEQNRANKERADSERQALLMEQLSGEVRAFAENVAYRKIVKKKNLPY